MGESPLPLWHFRGAATGSFCGLVKCGQIHRRNQSAEECNCHTLANLQNDNSVCNNNCCGVGSSEFVNLCAPSMLSWQTQSLHPWGEVDLCFIWWCSLMLNSLEEYGFCFFQHSGFSSASRTGRVLSLRSNYQGPLFGSLKAVMGCSQEGHQFFHLNRPPVFSI